jgi:cell pole-organizing protein PopZ
MTQPAKAQEPSMEEILASIRRIIADDDTAKGPPAASAPAPPQPSPSVMEQRAPREEFSATAPAENSSDVLDLTEDMATPATGRAEGFRTINGDSDVVFEDADEESPSRTRDREPPPMEPPRRQSPADERALLSSFTSAAVDSAFNTLAHTVLVQNARTLEDLVREMLRPMLKTWLDDNLPSMVERLVRAEIERVSRGRS